MIYKALEEEALQQDDKRDTVLKERDAEDALIIAASAALPTQKSSVTWPLHRAAVTALVMHGSSVLSGAGTQLTL